MTVNYNTDNICVRYVQQAIPARIILSIQITIRTVEIHNYIPKYILFRDFIEKFCVS